MSVDDLLSDSHPGLDTLIIESAVDFAIFALDLSGTIVRWSRGAESILGWSTAEAIGQPGAMIFTAEDRAAALPEYEIQTSLANGRSLDERWHLRKDQTRFWASGEMMTLRTDDGRVTGLVKIVRDRTTQWLDEQKQIALSKLGEGIANMVHAGEMSALASDLVRCTLDAAGCCYATVNEGILIQGQSIAPSTIGTETRLIEACDRYLLSNGGFTTTTRSSGNVTADASPIGAFCIVPIFESQLLVAMFAVVSDGERRWTLAEEHFIREIAVRSRFAIERRRAENSLQQLATSLERQVERRVVERNRLWANTHDLMAVIDARGVVAEINPAWKKHLGWEASDLIGGSFGKVTDEQGFATLLQSIAAGDQAEFRVDIKAANHQVRRVNWTLSRDQDAAFLIGRDVTDQLETEARLRQAQKMEAIGQLTGGLAHDFNNLLAGIIGSIDLIRLRLANNRKEDVERHIQAARTAAHRAAALTHRLLAFSRQQPLQREPTDLNRLVAGMEELLRRTLHVRIELELKLDATCMVLSDAHQLENAILNLVINARDALPGPGKITIATEDCGKDRPLPSRSKRLAESASNYACVSVIDNGHGMTQEVVSKVFEPFFTTKPAGQGTGLGLAMIYSFVQQMDGEIDLVTELGRGTTLRLFFPCAKTSDTATSEAIASAYPQGEGERILVVEDDAIVRATMIEMLRELGYAPEGVDRCQSALDLLSQEGNHLDAVITDWGLPGLNGGALAQLARERRPDLPICFVTGYNSGDAEIETLRPNEILLTKPVGIEVLARVVREMLGRSG